MQRKCIYLPLHLSQIPLTTKLTSSAIKLLGKLIWGILRSVKHTVSLQLVK